MLQGAHEIAGSCASLGCECRVKEQSCSTVHVGTEDLPSSHRTGEVMRVQEGVKCRVDRLRLLLRMWDEQLIMAWRLRDCRVHMPGCRWGA